MKFEMLRPKIEAELKKRGIDLEKEFILINGFVNQSLAQTAGEIVIGGPVAPMIMLVERNSGKVQFVAFKALEIK